VLSLLLLFFVPAVLVPCPGGIICAQVASKVACVQKAGLFCHLTFTFGATRKREPDFRPPLRKLRRASDFLRTSPGTLTFPYHEIAAVTTFLRLLQVDNIAGPPIPRSLSVSYQRIVIDFF
jgi:hypothetical protein